MTFLPLKKLIDKRIEKYSFKNDILAFDVCQVWENVIKEFLKKKSLEKTKALFFKNKTLYIEVENIAFSKELQFKKEKLIKKLNKKLNKKLVEDIIFRI